MAQKHTKSQRAGHDEDPDDGELPLTDEVTDMFMVLIFGAADY